MMLLIIGTKYSRKQQKETNERRCKKRVIEVNKEK